MGPTKGHNNNPGAGNGWIWRAAVAVAAFLFFPVPAFAQDLPPLARRDVGLAAGTSGAVALAIAAALWAIAEQKISGKLKRGLRAAGARTRAAVGERDAL